MCPPLVLYFGFSPAEAVKVFAPAFSDGIAIGVAKIRLYDLVSDDSLMLITEALLTERFIE
jgi:hypothetical protein